MALFTVNYIARLCHRGHPGAQRGEVRSARVLSNLLVFSVLHGPYSRMHGLILSLLLCAAGCAHHLEPGFKRGSGDVRIAIVREAITRGGTPLDLNEGPPIPGAWRYQRDEHGLVVRLPRSSYPAIEQFFLAAFGQPKIGPKDTSTGGRFGQYRLSAKGGGIQFIRDEQQTQVIVLGPITTEEILQRLPDVARELQKERR
jgi:hypothetical protein